MDATIAALLTQDGITNGAIYALLALALVLVFAVTRVIWVPSGEFVAYGTLTLAGLQLGKAPGTVGLLAGMAVIAGVMEIYACLRRGEARRMPLQLLLWTGVPLAIAALVWWAAPSNYALAIQVALTLAAVTALGPLLYRDRLPAGGRGERAGAADRFGRRALRADGARPVVLRRRGVAHAGVHRRDRSRSARST